MELDPTLRQIEFLKIAVNGAWGRVIIIRANESKPLVYHGLLNPIKSMVFEITDHGIEFLGLSVEQVRSDQKAKREAITS
jgi:hypothetical protein